MFVIGMGESKTPQAFKSACDTFKYLDVLMGVKAETEAADRKSKKPEAHGKAGKTEPDKTQERAEKEKAAKSPKKQPAKPEPHSRQEAAAPEEAAAPVTIHSEEELAGAFVPLEEIVSKIREIIDYDADEDGFMPLSQVGVMLSRMYADFDTRNYGFNQLHKLIDYTGAFETKYEQFENGGKNLVVRNK